METAVQHTRLTIIVAGMIAAVGCHAVRAVPSQSVSAAAIEQPVPNMSWSAESYRVQWEDPQIPEVVAANVAMAVPVTVRNIGNRRWPTSLVFVSYHWYRDHRIVVWDGERTALPRELGAGSRAALSVRVVTPAEPGSYVLQLTLVHELVTWFESKGASTIIRPVAVRPPTQSPDISIGGATP